MLKQINYQEARKLKAHALKEFVDIDSNPNNVWFGCYNSDDLVGVGCYLLLKNTHVRLKGLFVKSEFRRKGIAKTLTDACVKHSQGKLFSAFATNQSLPMYWKYFSIQYEKDRKVQVREQEIQITYIKFRTYA